MSRSTQTSTLIALVVTSLSAEGCLFWGCGDRTFENREVVGTYPVDADGMIQIYGATVADPDTAEGCEEACQNAFYGFITEIHTCAVEITESDDDSGQADTGGTGMVAEVTCVVSGEDECVGGRHTSTLVQRAQGQGQDAVGAWLAREACGEAGSVHAFRQLARELRHHGAPDALIAAARAAAADEVRHARMVRRLALRRGGSPEAVRVRATPPRPLLALALENAVEGCVQETFAAARAGWQARHAADPEVRRVSAVLAEDEGRHADLAAAVHAWALSVLPPQEAAQVEGARLEAWARLAGQEPAVSEAVVRVLGVPDAGAHRALARGLAAALAA